MDEASTDERTSTPDLDERIRSGIPLVHYAVNDLSARVPRHIPREDLVSAGFLGLAQAARSWDPAREVTFERYARTRIRGALLDELRGRDWATRSVRGQARHLKAATEEHTRTTGRAPSAPELAATMGLSTEELAQLTAQVHRTTVLQFDAIFTNPDDVPIRLPEEDAPLESLLRRERLAYLRDAVDCLPERLRKVVVEYFFEQRQMQDIGDDLGVTESRVSQLRAEAITFLRAGMAAVVSDADTPTARPGGRSTPRLSAYLAEVAATSSTRSRRTIRPAAPAPLSASA